MSARLPCSDIPELLLPSAPAVMLAAAILVAMAGAALPSQAAAQAPAQSPAQAPAAKVAATAVAPGAAAAVTKPPAAKKGKAASAKKAVEPPPEPETVVADADDEQLSAAKEVYLGESGCEFNQKIQVDANVAHPGYVDMNFNKKKYMMKPVRSSTGALRLEDVRSEALMIQISSKTMLMNQKTGQRMVDNCVHPDQKVTAADAEQVLMK